MGRGTERDERGTYIVKNRQNYATSFPERNAKLALGKSKSAKKIMGTKGTERGKNSFRNVGNVRNVKIVPERWGTVIQTWKLFRNGNLFFRSVPCPSLAMNHSLWLIGYVIPLWHWFGPHWNPWGRLTFGKVLLLPSVAKIKIVKCLSLPTIEFKKSFIGAFYAYDS